MGFLILILTIVVYLLRPAEWIPALYFNWNFLLIALGSIVLIGNFLKYRRKVRHDRTLYYLLAFMMAVVASNVVHAQFATIGDYSLQILSNAITFLLVQVYVDSTRKSENFIAIIVVLISFIGFQCFLQMTSGSNWGGLEPAMRSEVALGGFESVTILTPQVIWFGIFEDPNDLGMLLIAFVPYVLSKIIYQPIGTTAKIMWAGLLPSILVALYFTNSRGSFLALIGAISIFFVLKRRSVAGLIVGGIIAFMILMLGPTRLATLFAGDYSAMGRVYAWILSLELLAMNPVLGVGSQHFVDYHSMTAHNSYVLAMVETGVVGFIAYFGFFLIPVNTAVRVALNEPDEAKRIQIISLVSGLIGILISMFFISRTYVLFPLLYVAIMMAHTRCLSAKLFDESIALLKFGRVSALSVGFIIFVYVINRLSTALML